MKKKFILLMMMCLLGLFSSPLKAQEDVATINGDATSYSNIYPIAFNYYYQLSQHIYTAEEINHAAGTIEKIAFKVNVTQNRNLTFYLINTDKSVLSGWESFSDADKVFGQTISTAPTDGWLTIELENSFEYTGGNILLVAHDNTGSNVYTYAAGSAYVTTTKNATFYATGSNPVSTSTSGYTSTRQPAVRFTFAAVDDGLEPAAPTNLVATAVDHRSISLTWNAAENAKAYNVYQEDVKVATVTNTSYTVESLDAESEYCFTVTGIRGTKESAHSTETCATTAKAPASLNVVFTLKDSYGDGWNGGTLTVTANDGTNQTFAFTSGAEKVYTLNILQGADVTVTFNAGSYTEECTYCIAYEDEEEIHCSGTMNFYDNRTYSFTVKTLSPSVEVTPLEIDFDDVRIGNYWSDKETASANVDIKAIITTITSITCNNNFFTLNYDIDENPISLKVSYNPEAEVTGEQSGTITITSADCDPITVTVTATAYTATEPDAIEAYTIIAFTDGEYTNTPTFANLHDDYVLPAEVNEGETPDAVYKFTLTEDAVVTANVTGTNGIAAIYKAEDLEGNGPSADNNYEGVEGAPEVPITPTTFFYDFEGGNLEDNFTLIDADSDGHNWKLVPGEGGNLLGSYSWDNNIILNPDNYIYTKQVYSITANSKLTYIVQAANYPDHYAVVVSEDGVNFDILFEEDYQSYDPASREVDLSTYAGKDLHIGLRHYNCSNEYVIYIDNFQLIDGSAKTRTGEAQINAVQYPAGTYYLVAAAEDEFTVSISISTLPAPEAITLTAPENNALEQDNPKLIWSLGNYTSEYQLLLGTTNPPTDVVVDWTTTLANSYQTSELEVGTKYYWQVKAKNDKGSTESEVWSFVTPLNKPTELAATATNLYPGDETTISWTAAEGATGYNVYVNDVKVNEEPVTETSYTLSNLAYNMNPGNAIAVTAVHALGESAKSDAVVVKVAGEFTLVVNVKDAEGNALEGAAVAFNTESYYDEYYQLVPAVETLYTDANGQITQVLPLPCVYGDPNWQYAQMTVTVSKEYANNSYININSYTELTNGEEYVQNVTLQYVAPQTIQLDDYYNQYVVGEEMTMTWDAVDGAIGYNVYERGEWNDETSAFDYTLLTTESLTEETFTVELTEYDPIYGLVYAVAAVYSVGESPKTEKNVYVTGKSQISAVVKDANDEALKGAIVTLVGKDDFNNDRTFEFTTDANGAITEEDVLVGTYTATISHYDYEDYITNEFIIEYGTPYNLGTITLTARAEATIAVTATEAADGSKVDVSWEAEYEKYNVYRRNVETEEFVKIASDVTLTEYEATDWAALENGTYQYGVSGLSEVGLPVETFSGTTIPEGWQFAGAYQAWWTFDGNTAAITKDEYSANAIELVSPMINLNGINSPQVTYQYKSGSQYWSNQYTSTVIVSASESLDGPWTELDRDTYDKGSTNDFVTRVVSLTAFEGKSIYVKFGTTTNYSSTYFDNIVFPQGSTNTKPVWSEPIEKVVVEFTNAAEDNNWHNAANWSTGSVPTAENNVVISAAAVISSQNAVAKNITIASGASVTVSAERTLTAQNIYNTGYAHSQLIINDGAQVIQNNEGVLATFNMGIVNPETWGVSSDGWQFIAVPFTDAAFVNFTGFMATNYDLFKYDGEAEDEWQNHKDNVGFGDAGFVNGRAYLASHENKETATIYGTLNSAMTHTYTVTYNAEKDLANFHLLGNPFSFDMDWSNIAVEGIYNGFATVNSADGSYDYSTSGTIPVGDGFFVRATAENPTISYGAAKRGYEKYESINLIATGTNGDDNAIINFADSDNEGFLKLDNINTEIANIYFSNSGKRYAISNFDREITEIPVSFDAKQMGSYTIAAQPQGKFESVILVDRFTGVETNLLLEDYNFTSTGDENHDRFIVKLVNSQQTTDNSHFAYVSGEDLILNIEGSVQIIDVMGRVIYANDVTSDNNRINVSNFDNAAYVIRVINENGVKVQKIIL